MCAAVSVRAELVERRDGTLFVGQVISNEGGVVKLRTGPNDADVSELGKSDIKRILTPAEELSANLGESSAEVLERRARSYHRAGLDFEALVCLERLVALAGKRATTRASADEGEWAAFKTGAIIRIESRRESDAGRLLSFARLAAGADDKHLCSDLIFRADGQRGGAGPARAAALELGVTAPSAHRIDFYPCLFEAAEARSIQDEDLHVPAQPDRVFVHIPIRIDLGIELSLSKGSLRGRDARSLYGLRPMRLIGGRPGWQPGRGDPVYERLDYTPASGEWVFRNSTPPRRTDDSPPRDRSGAREQRIKATPWIVLILELRQGAVATTLQLPGESTEDLDLTFIRRAHEPVPEWHDPQNPPPEALVSVVERLDRAGQAPADKRDSLRATTLLALARLEAARATQGERASKEWRSLTNNAVVNAIGGGDPVVGLAGWEYLSKTPPAAHVELADAIAAHANGHLALARAIERVSRDELDDSGASYHALAAILRNGEAVASARALDTIERLDRTTLWMALCDSRRGAKALALSRLRSLESTDKRARRAAGALVGGMDRDLSMHILEAAKRFGFAIESADDAILERWPAFKDQISRAAFLEGLALAGKDIAGVWHSPAISAIAMDVYKTKNKRILAAWTAMVAAHRAATPGASTGMFPMLVARESADPDLLGLNAVASHGEPDDRRTAIRSLLALGYAEEVERALGSSAGKDWPVVLSTGIKKEDELAILGLLARWSATGSDELATAAMSQLSRVLSEVSPDRSWLAAAAIKSGLTLEALNELSWDVDPMAAGAALRVAYAAGHMTQQERQRVAGAADAGERLDELQAVDLRRGQLVDGAYGALAIVETTTRVKNGAGGAYWSEPVRTMLELPQLRLEVDVIDDRITALHNGKPVGSGLAIAADRMIKPLPFYYGVLEALDGDEFVVRTENATSQPAAASRPTTSRPAAVRPGPMVLPDTRGRTEGSGLMVIDLGAFADEVSARTGAGKINFQWPREFPLTLRYHLWGTWVGCGRRQELPATAQPGDTRLLNMMVIVEKMSP